MTNVAVYTPDCFVQGGTLSHLEDMCYPTATASNNNIYFPMSNNVFQADDKRFFRQEEKNIFCDLGFNTINTYTSNALGAPTTYTGSCSPRLVYGVNDGIGQGGAFTYTTATNIFTIPITGTAGILANDSPNSATASCIDLVYNVGTYTVVGNTISFTANPSYNGVNTLALCRSLYIQWKQIFNYLFFVICF